jgi:hypothetical protein
MAEGKGNGLGLITLVRKKISELNPAPYNPRTMTDKARQGLSNSIDAFGLVQPIIWNRQTGNVVGGHQRLYDLITKGVEETDVVEVDIPLIKEKALNISLNNSAISGDYDDDKLQELLGELNEEMKIDLMLEDLGPKLFSDVGKANKEINQDILNVRMKFSFDLSFDDYQFVNTKFVALSADKNQLFLDWVKSL